jgi:hypothetical protein
MKKIIIILMLVSCSPTKKTKPCTQCPQYTQEIDRLNKEIEDNKLVIEQIEQDYYVLWKENQIFASMLAEIDNERNGHELLKQLWDKYREI